MATITSTGTWSALQNTNPTSLVPGATPNEVINAGDTFVEQRFQNTSLSPRDAFTANIDGLQEVMQFVGLFAAGYSIPTTAALARIGDIIKAYKNSEEVATRRVYEP